MDRCKGLDETSLLHAYLPDIQHAICENFQSAECSVEGSPELTESPFNFAIHSLGKKIYLLPSGSTIPKDFYQISIMSEGIIVSDGLASEYLHLVLGSGDDWRTPLQKVFNEKLATNWCFLVLELQSGVPHFHLLHAQTKAVKSYTECAILWLSEMKQPQVPQPTPKPKIVKKIVKKSVVDKNIAETETNGKTVAIKTTKISNGQKTVRKKLSASLSTTTATAVAVIDSDMKAGNDVSFSNKKTVPSKARNSLTNAVGSENYVNGDGSADSGVSVVDSDTEKSSRCMRDNEFDEVEKIPSRMRQTDTVTDNEFATLKTNPVPTSEISPETTSNDEINKTHRTATAVISTTDNTSTRHNTPTRISNCVTDYRHEIKKKMEKILEEEEKQWERSVAGYTNGQSRSDDYLIGREPSIRTRRCTPTRSSLNCLNNFLSNGLQRIPSRDDDISVIKRFADEEIPPVQVLQLVLAKFSYKELGEMRQVHPHWDELCGQKLNNGYYELTKKADKLLTECQRRVHSEPDLHDVLSILTNVQVHILNPVDILRPAMDEGVCCFPYGELLDQTFHIIKEAEEMIRGKQNIAIKWKPVAEMAKRAQLHYKFSLEALMEEKLGEVIRLKALQSIQRIDSFMIDSTVNKLEKAAHMARDDLEWEIEQLRHQNAQLKKDNRELKKDCMRLEARVEIIENKFKTMARLLQ
uniref:Uncharacterized protein n=1 Tax=Setaria digitata TaxID=48799 RepID=A0A915Q4K2_9BILA